MDNADLFMDKAFDQAQVALENCEVPVGCIFVHNGVEIGQGSNQSNKTKNPTIHAEIAAIREMEKQIPNLKEILPEVTLYVTLEPCVMCAAALYELGIKKIVYGAENERFGGIRSIGNAEKYKAVNSIEIKGLVQAKRSIDLLKKFYDKENPFAPENKKTKKNKKGKLNK